MWGWVMGNLYQLCSNTKKPNGSYFHVNGPYDRHGYVIKSEQKPNGEWLNLVRGTGNKKTEYKYGKVPYSEPMKQIQPQKLHTFKGNKFNAIKQCVSEMLNGVVKVKNNLGGNRGYGLYRLISMSETEITIQNKNNPKELITIMK